MTMTGISAVFLKTTPIQRVCRSFLQGDIFLLISEIFLLIFFLTSSKIVTKYFNTFNLKKANEIVQFF